jgi:carboxymethylenebutenolidase
MTKRVSFSNIEGELAEPAGEGNAPAVVLIQEWWGVNDHIRGLVDRLAKDGFLVVAPDLYHGKTTKDAGEAGKWMGELDTMKAVKEIGAAVAYLKEHPRGNGKVGVTGFCMGGALTLASACHVPGLSAAVSFYGIPSPEKVDYAKATIPVQMHVAKKDGWVTPEKAEEVKKQLKNVELHLYDADHAFVNDTRPEVYDAEAAKLAWQRAVDFFKKHLG